METKHDNKEVESVCYCAHCGQEFVTYSDGTNSEEYYTFENDDNTYYCRECYAEIETEREREDEQAYYTQKELKERVESVLDSYDVTYTRTTASTGSVYWSCEAESGRFFKVRLADHSQCYDADINIATQESNQDGIELDDFEEFLQDYL